MSKRTGSGSKLTSSENVKRTHSTRRSNLISLNWRPMVASLLTSISLIAHGAPGKSYIDERTGQQCIQQIPADPTDPYQPNETHGYFYLKNICPRSFSLVVTLSNGKVKSSGIEANGKSHIACVRAAGECDGRASWEVR